MQNEVLESMKTTIQILQGVAERIGAAVIESHGVVSIHLDGMKATHDSSKTSAIILALNAKESESINAQIAKGMLFDLMTKVIENETTGK